MTPALLSSSFQRSSRRPRVLSVIGARPEIIQAAPVSAALAGIADEILVHTGQHYDRSMSGDQIVATGLPRPVHNLGIGSRPRAQQLRLGEERLGEVIAREHPDVVLVRGDTNATLSGARAAVAAGVALIHVEAGLRAHRDDLPEEDNRVETDSLADVLCAPSEAARDNLLAELVAGTVHVTGDPLRDALEQWRGHVVAHPGTYLLATVHRSHNTDDPLRLQGVLDCLARSPWPVVMPLHPRTRAALAAWKIALPDGVRAIEPVAYPDMLALERGAKAVATDSGGVQREAYLWGVPCLTLREETEWTDTVRTGWNTVVDIDPDRFDAALRLSRPLSRPAIFGDGRAARRIAALTVALAADRTRMSRSPRPSCDRPVTGLAATFEPRPG